MSELLIDNFPEFKSKCLMNLERLFNDSFIKNRLFLYNSSLKQVYFTVDQKNLFKRIFLHYLEEAQNIIRLLDAFNIPKNEQLIEIGGGIGLTYAYLKTQDYKILSLEPSTPGFDNSYKAGLKILEILQIDSSGWLPYMAEEINKVKNKADIIFSQNTLEHVNNLNKVFLALKDSLKKDGLIIHTTVNYAIPYDPHFKILLFPFIPKLTQIFKPYLTKYELWNNLNFITFFSVKKDAHLANLNIDFRKDSLINALIRLDTDEEYGYRHKLLKSIYNVLKATPLLNLFKIIPIPLQTPLVFTLTKKNK